jgi:hypothetical protein
MKQDTFEPMSRAARRWALIGGLSLLAALALPALAQQPSSAQAQPAAPAKTQPAAAAAADTAEAWPHTMRGDAGSALVYQPQVISWPDRQTLNTRIAMALTPTGAKTVLGASRSASPRRPTWRHAR